MQFNSSTLDNGAHVNIKPISNRVHTWIYRHHLHPLRTDSESDSTHTHTWPFDGTPPSQIMAPAIRVNLSSEYQTCSAVCICHPLSNRPNPKSITLLVRHRLSVQTSCPSPPSCVRNVSSNIFRTAIGSRTRCVCY